MPRSHQEDPELLNAALIGLQHTLSALEERIADLRRQLGARTVAHRAAPAPGATKHNMSAAARKRIALAQKKRWAAYNAAKAKQASAAKPAKPVKPAKHSISAEGRARIAAATKKRWAAFRKAQKTPATPAPVAAAAATAAD